MVEAANHGEDLVSNVGVREASLEEPVILVSKTILIKLVIRMTQTDVVFSKTFTIVELCVIYSFKSRG